MSSTPQQSTTPTPLPRIHGMACEYPEGCSCGAAQYNALVAELTAARVELSTATMLLCDIKDRVKADKDFSADEIIELLDKHLCKLSQGPSWIVRKVFEEETADLHAQLQAKEQELAEAKVKQPINTSTRLFDLVRYMRAELHRDNLITDDEYAWLCTSSMAQSPKGGSPSPRRLEDYDALRQQLADRDATIAGLRDALGVAVSVIDGLYDQQAMSDESARPQVESIRAMLAQVPPLKPDAPCRDCKGTGWLTMGEAGGWRYCPRCSTP